MDLAFYVVVLAPVMTKANQCCALGGAVLPGVEAELAVCTALPSAPALQSLVPVS